MMPLKILPLAFDDVDAMINHADIYEPGDDLIAPPTSFCWPVTTREEATARLNFHMSKQRKRYMGDKSVRFMKVVNEDEEIISVARWHFYPAGYIFEKEIHWEVHEPSPEDVLMEGMNITLHNFVLSGRDREREKWIGQGKPCWILMHMVTRPSHRGRGAAGMLINWGIEQAEKDGVPAYLEAGAMGRPIYQKHGFEQVGELMSMDLRPLGADLDFVMAKMVYVPRSAKAIDRNYTKSPDR